MRKFLCVICGFLFACLVVAIFHYIFRNEAKLVYNTDGAPPMETWNYAKNNDGVTHYAIWDGKSRCWRWVFMQRELPLRLFEINVAGVQVEVERKWENVNKFDGPLREDEITDKVYANYKIKQVVKFRDGNYGIYAGAPDFPTWSVFTPAAARKYCMKYGVNFEIND